MGICNPLRNFWFSQKVILPQTVQINDWRLGLLYNALVVLILWYVLVYQIIYAKQHLKTTFISGDSSLGISRMSDLYKVTLPPTDLNESCLDREESQIFEVKKPATLLPSRLPAFELVERHGQNAIMIPTLVKETKKSYGCYARKATVSGSGNVCEDMPNETETYTELFDDHEGVSFENGARMTNYVIQDPTRLVLLAQHSPRMEPHARAVLTKVNFDLDDLTGFMIKPNKELYEKVHKGTNTTEAEENVKSRKPYRMAHKQLDYIPLDYILDNLLNVTSNCSDTSRDYQPLLNGFTVVLSIRYYNDPLPEKPSWTLHDLFGDSVLKYSVSARLASNRSFFYKSSKNFERTKGLIQKIHGITIQLEAHGEIHEFDPIWLTSVFLPQLLALITVASIVVRNLMLYGGDFVLDSFFSVCNMFRLTRPFSVFGSRGARGCWYKAYLNYQTPNLAVIDYFLRCVNDGTSQKDTARIPEGLPCDLPPFDLHGYAVGPNEDGHTLSAFNEDGSKVFHNLPREHLQAQLQRLSSYIQYEAESKGLDGGDDLVRKVSTSIELRTLLDIAQDSDEEYDSAESGSEDNSVSMAVGARALAAWTEKNRGLGRR